MEQCLHACHQIIERWKFSIEQIMLQSYRHTTTAQIHPDLSHSRANPPFLSPGERSASQPVSHPASSRPPGLQDSEQQVIEFWSSVAAGQPVNQKLLTTSDWVTMLTTANKAKAIKSRKNMRYWNANGAKQS